MPRQISYQWLAVIAVMMGAFMTVLNNSLINVALPTLMQVLDATPGEIQWVVTGFMLTLGIVIPASGYLSATLGTKRLYLLALFVFVVGSALGSQAGSVGSLVFFRVIQAMGAGMVMPVSMTIIYRAVPLEQRGAALGVWGIAAMAAPAIGPTLSGYILQYSSWHYLFLVNVPVGILAMILGSFLLRESARARDRHFDLVGFAASTVGVGSLLLSMNLGPGKGWGSPTFIGLLALAIVTLGFFVAWELRQKEPLLDLRILQVPTYRLGIVLNTTISLGMFSGILLIPLFTQEVLGFTPVQTGLVLMPAALIQALFQPVSGRWLDRSGPRVVVFTGVLIVAVSTLALGFISPETTFLWLALWLALRGVGLGLAMMTATTAGLNMVPLAKVAEASAMANTVRQASASVGLVLVTMLYENRVVAYAAAGGEPLAGTALNQAKALAAGHAFLAVAVLVVLVAPLALRLRSPREMEAAAE